MVRIHLINHFSSITSSLRQLMQITTPDGDLRFDTVADLLHWLESETKFWEWLPSVRDSYFASGTAWSAFSSLFRLHRELKGLPAEELEATELHMDWLTEIKENYESGAILLSSSPMAVFVEQLRKRNEELAKHALSYFLGKPASSLTSIEAIDGVVRAALFKFGVKENAASERDAIRQLKKSWTSQLAREAERWTEQLEHLASVFEERTRDYEARMTALATQANSELKECEALRTRSETEYQEIAAAIHEEHAKQVEAFGSAFQEKLADSEQRLHDIAALYRERMALKSPVEYWSENRDYHERSARRYLRWLRWTVPCAIIAISAVGWFLLGQEREPAWGRVIFFFVLAGLLVWMLRILVRLYLQHLHLQIDAHERIVMVKTYLALRSEGVSAGETEVSIVFNALFRPALAGASGDESVPTSVVELLGKAFGSGK